MSSSPLFCPFSPVDAPSGFRDHGSQLRPDSTLPFPTLSVDATLLGPASAFSFSLIFKSLPASLTSCQHATGPMVFP